MFNLGLGSTSFGAAAPAGAPTFLIPAPLAAQPAAQPAPTSAFASMSAFQVAAPAPQPNNFSLGGQPAPASTLFVPSAPAPAEGVSVAPVTAPAPAAPPAPTSTSRLPPLPPVDISAQTLGALLASWTEEVTRQKDDFKAQAEKVAEWDSQLRQAQVALWRLCSDKEELYDAQKKLDVSLEAVEKHQTRMDHMLGKAEAVLDALLPEKDAAGNPIATSPAAAGTRARLEAYETAIKIDGVLNALENSVRDLERNLARTQAADDKDQLSHERAALAEEMRCLVEVEKTSSRLMEQARSLSADAEAALGPPRGTAFHGGLGQGYSQGY